MGQPSGSALRSTGMCFPVSKTLVAVAVAVGEHVEAIFLSCTYSEEILSPCVEVMASLSGGSLVDFCVG